MRFWWLLLFIPLACAQGSGGCQEHFDLDDESESSVDYEYAYICDGEIRSVEFHFGPGTDAHFSIEAADISGGGQGSVVAADLRVGLASIVEFVDNDGDGAYTPGEDTVVQQDDIVGQRWSTVSSSETSDGIRFSASYNIAFGGRFTITGVATIEPYRAGGIRVQPTDTKIDFGFQGLSYERASSQLALVLDIDGESANVAGSPGGVQSGEAGIEVGGSDVAYFTWVKTAQVDGASSPVRSVTIGEGEHASVRSAGGTVEADEFSGQVSLAYARGTEIMHDPRLGAAFNETSSNGSPSPFWIALPLLGAAAWRRR